MKLSRTRVVATVLLLASPSVGQDTSDSPVPQDKTPGHSYHAQAFNEGPRQGAYLMPGMGNVHWQTTTPSPMAQRFFDQGLAQLHGFWYFEAERSFRQASAIDPDCAIHYWGMARANLENPARSHGFIQQAMRRIESANPLERRLIEAWNQRVSNWPEDPVPDAKPGASDTSKKRRSAREATEQVREQRKERLKQYGKALEEIASDHREDIEVKAMLVLQYWQNQGEGIEIQSPVAIDALLSEIFRVNPRHPAQHFRIHLWDYRKEALALSAAALCGPSAPGIAHMWHMPGHTYSRLHRYADAAWQQEASARVDHAHMIRDRILPDQIHNYAHNNEWLIRNWLYVGRVDDAVALAKNMIELPRHPEYNAIDAQGSSQYGRQRLIGALSLYQRWKEMAELCDTVYLHHDQDPPYWQDAARVWHAIAKSQLGRADDAMSARESLMATRRTLRQSIAQPQDAAAGAGTLPPTLLAPAEPPPDLFGAPSDPTLPASVRREFDEAAWKDKPEGERERARQRHDLEFRHYRLGQGLAALEAYLAAQRSDYRSAVRWSAESGEMIDALAKLEWCSLAGEHALAVRKAREQFDASPGQILPAAVAAWVANRAIQAASPSSPLEEWSELRKRALQQCSELASGCDDALPWVERARGVAQQALPEMVWGHVLNAPKDLGDRPSLDSLGPVRWRPAAAPLWSAIGSDGQEWSSKQLAGKPYVLILYLGFGCLHCAEQLGKFSPEIDRFREAGIDVRGISTESPSSLVEGLKRYDREMRIALASNERLDVFQAFRCFDDFEGQPLHGTIFVDGQGRIRWQDIGHEPFMDPDFVLREAERLLRVTHDPSTAKATDTSAQASR